jgi:hypothetical protein
MAEIKDNFFSTGTKFYKFRTLSEKQVELFEKGSRCAILLIINSNKGSTRGKDSNSWFGEKTGKSGRERNVN